MGKITVWECEDTKELFRDERSYRNHRRKYLSRSRKLQEKQKYRTECLNKINQIYELESIPEIIQFIHDNFELIYRTCFWETKTKVPPKIESIKIYSYHYSKETSNSHSSPKNGVQNWSRDKDKPLGYPGISGRIDIKYSETGRVEESFWVSNFFEFLRIHTGTGGGGTGGASFDVKMFFDDYVGFGRQALYAEVAGINIDQHLRSL